MGKQTKTKKQEINVISKDYGDEELVSVEYLKNTEFQQTRQYRNRIIKCINHVLQRATPPVIMTFTALESDNVSLYQDALLEVYDELIAKGFKLKECNRPNENKWTVHINY